MAMSLADLISKVQTVFTGYASKLMVAIIILLMGFIVGKVIGKLIQKVLHEMELDSLLKKIIKMKVPVEQVIGNLSMYFIYFVAIIMALRQIGIATDILNIILAGFVIIIILALFLSIKDFVPNLISGIFIHQKEYFTVGDYIRIDNMQGRIIEISLIETMVKTSQGDIIYIPNSRLTKSEVIKISKKKL
jgi:small-conductance mechanosensitive channel